MTPRVERAVVVAGDRVADKRWKGKARPGRGVVVEVVMGGVFVRWDGTDHVGFRDHAMIEKIDAEPGG